MISASHLTVPEQKKKEGEKREKIEMNVIEIPLRWASMYGAWKKRKLPTKLDGGVLDMQDPIQM